MNEPALKIPGFIKSLKGKGDFSDDAIDYYLSFQTSKCVKEKKIFLRKAKYAVSLLKLLKVAFDGTS